MPSHTLYCDTSRRAQGISLSLLCTVLDNTQRHTLMFRPPNSYQTIRAGSDPRGQTYFCIIVYIISLYVFRSNDTLYNRVGGRRLQQLNPINSSLLPVARYRCSRCVLPFK